MTATSLSRLFTACLVAAVPMLGQNFGPNPRGVALTHVHMNAADPDATIAFWTDLIGMGAVTRGSFKGVSTQGGLILFSKLAPSGPSAGSAIDHIALRVPDLQTFVEKLAKTRYKSFTPPDSHDTLMIDGPDGVRIELMEDNTMYAPLEFNHVHLNSKTPSEAQAWYAKFFGARSGGEGTANTSRLMAGTLMFSKADTVAPSAGRGIDHLSFEVRDMQAACKALTEGGVKLDPPFDGAAPPKGTSVFLTDPSGTRIELTAAAGSDH